MEERRETVVGEAQAGATVAAVVRELFDIPWSKARALCASGRVRVDGTPITDGAARVALGAQVEVDPTAPKRKKGVFPRESILHVDVDVVVVDKPAGVLTLPYDASDRDTLSDRVRAALRRMDWQRRDPMVGVVQRLDKDTTGVLVFARNMKAKRALQEQLRVHSVTRRYLAIAHGEARDACFETFLVQNRGDGLRGSWGTMPAHRGPPPKDAKRAVTHVRLRERLRGASLLECRLETGRQHQNPHPLERGRASSGR